MNEVYVEERQETCSTVSKLVKIRIFRKVIAEAPQQEGEITGFECSSASSTCESKCHYRMLLEDY